MHCPGCYAYGDNHLGDGPTLRELSDFRGDALVEGVLGLVEKHRALHVSLVGGEPLMRHRELNRILPELSARGHFVMVVTSAVIPIPMQWMTLPRLRVAVCADGLPEHHNVRRHPATYERILKNIEGRRINVHWTITRPMCALGTGQRMSLNLDAILPIRRIENAFRREVQDDLHLRGGKRKRKVQGDNGSPDGGPKTERWPKTECLG